MPSGFRFVLVLPHTIHHSSYPLPTPTTLYREVLEQVEDGYRMPKPDGCPDALFNIMLSTWNRETEKRPTFEYLKSTLEDYYVSAAEGAYREPGAG